MEKSKGDLSNKQCPETDEFSVFTSHMYVRKNQKQKAFRAKIRFSRKYIFIYRVVKSL